MERGCGWWGLGRREAWMIKLRYSLRAYVFMPDHVHLIVFPHDRIYDDSEFLRRIKEPVSEAVQFLKRESSGWLPRIRVRRGTRVEHRFRQPGRGHNRDVNSTRGAAGHDRLQFT